MKMGDGTHVVRILMTSCVVFLKLLEPLNMPRISPDQTTFDTPFTLSTKQTEGESLTLSIAQTLTRISLQNTEPQLQMALKQMMPLELLQLSWALKRLSVALTKT